MTAIAPSLLLVYAAGVIVGIVAGRDTPLVRIGLALMWPLGPIAFVVTVAMLLAVAAVAFPLFGVFLAAAALVGWWILAS